MRVHPLGVHGSRQRQLEPERSLADAHRVVRRRGLGRREVPPPLDDQRILEELHLEVLLVDPGEVHDDLDAGRRFIAVGVGPPAVDWTSTA